MVSRLLILLTLVSLAYCKLIDLSCDDIRQVVDVHNSMRLRVANGSIVGQPGAEKMNSLIWDEELAAKAANWTDYLSNADVFKHNPVRTIGSGRWSTGENLYRSVQKGISIHQVLEDALMAWFDEYREYSYGPLDHSRNHTGHYTQMVWSGTTHVGCAVAEAPEEIMCPKQYGCKRYKVACNYGPAGNYIGAKPYKSGNGTNSLACGASDCQRAYGDKCSPVQKTQKSVVKQLIDFLLMRDTLGIFKN